jgi:hypothetical protein
MSNLDDFNKATAVILSKVYETFPQRLAIPVGEWVDNPMDVNLYGDTIMWLSREGFLSFENRSGNQQFYGVTLTTKGLMALNSMPDVVKDHSTLGQKLAKAAKENSKEALKGLVNQLLQFSVTALLKHQIGD